MRNVFFVAVLLSPFAANAGSIDLDSSSYWQVQKASDYVTLCEGFVTQCEVEPGVYNVINLTTGERQNGIVVAPENEAGFSKPEIVTNVCDWRDVSPTSTDTSVPNAVKGYGVLDCDASCPAGKILVGTIECTISSELVGSDFLIGKYFPTAMIASDNGANCRAVSDVFEGQMPLDTTVTIACQ